MDRMRCKQEASKKGDSPMRLRRSSFSQMYGKVKEGKINHDTGKNIKKDVSDMITDGIQLPEMIIDGIT